MKRLWETTYCHFSPCKLYRYFLTRQFPADLHRKGRVTFLMLNPSTADLEKDDPTVRRCVGYAYDWNYLHLDVLNIFAYRATDPNKLLDIADPNGPENDQYIVKHLRQTEKVICAWGSHRSVKPRQARVLELIESVGLTPYCLKKTSKGQPYHPLYLKADLVPVPLL